MLIKRGDLNPIRIVNTTDIDVKSTKKQLKKAIQDIKDLEKEAEKKENEVVIKDKK
jgi:hypothetical protein